jgi:hypothetical protein
MKRTQLELVDQALAYECGKCGKQHVIIGSPEDFFAVLRSVGWFVLLHPYEPELVVQTQKAYQIYCSLKCLTDSLPRKAKVT